MNFYLTPLTIGLIMALLALGIYISYRIFDFPDLTADGAFTLGSVIALVSIQSGLNPFAATALGMLGGACAGSVTGLLQTRLGISKVVSGIIVMTSLFTVNYVIMGAGAIYVIDATGLKEFAATAAQGLFSDATRAAMRKIILGPDDIVFAFIVLVIVALAASGLFLFLRTNIGLALRASGENERMVRSHGVNAHWTVIIGLAIANGFVALSGALFVQEASNATDAQQGMGMLAAGLSIVLFGQSFAGRGRLGRTILSIVFGSVLLRYLVNIIIDLGLANHYQKLVYAAVLVVVLAIPHFRNRGAGR